MSPNTPVLVLFGERDIVHKALVFWEMARALPPASAVVRMTNETIPAIALMIQRDVKEKTVLIDCEVDKATLQSLQVRFASDDAYKNVRCLPREDGSK